MKKIQKIISFCIVHGDKLKELPYLIKLSYKNFAYLKRQVPEGFYTIVIFASMTIIGCLGSCKTLLAFTEVLLVVTLRTIH